MYFNKMARNRFRSIKLPTMTSWMKYPAYCMPNFVQVISEISFQFSAETIINTVVMDSENELKLYLVGI